MTKAALQFACTHCRQIRIWLNNQRGRALIPNWKGRDTLAACYSELHRIHTRWEEFPSRSQAYIYMERTKPKAHTRAHGGMIFAYCLSQIYMGHVCSASAGCRWLRLNSGHARTHSHTKPPARPPLRKTSSQMGDLLWKGCCVACNPSVSGAYALVSTFGRINYEQQAAVDFLASICNNRFVRWLKKSKLFFKFIKILMLICNKNILILFFLVINWL